MTIAYIIKSNIVSSGVVNKYTGAWCGKSIICLNRWQSNGNQCSEELNRQKKYREWQGKKKRGKKECKTTFNFYCFEQPDTDWSELCVGRE